MNRIDQALLCAFCVIAFSTIDSMGLSRVEPPRYRIVNNTQLQSQQGQMYPWNQPGNSAQTTHSPQPSWSAGQLNRYSTNTNNNGGFNSSISMSNPWQRYNYPPNHPSQHQQIPYQPNHNGGNLPANWQNPNAGNSTQSHLYPQLPNSNQNWNAMRQQPHGPQTTTTTTTTPLPMSMHPWNNTVSPAGANQNNWVNGQNAWGNAVPSYRNVPPATNTNYGKAPQNYPNDYNMQNPNSGPSWWHRPNSTYGNTNSNNNNFGFSGNPAPNQNTWNAGGNNPTAQNNWQPNLPSNPSTPTPSNNNNNNNNHNNNGWPNGAQNNWQGGNTGTGNNPNWYNSPKSPQGNTGAQLAPGQIGGISSGGVPLAPIGGGGGGSVINQPNSWNTAGNMGSPQLAPLAPLSYGTGSDSNDPNKRANTNPYSNMFN